MSGHERIRGEGLSHTYLTRTGETLALSNLDLTVRHGEFCGIVGPSGCGKSTLLAIICGLLQPSEGRILIDGVQLRMRLRRLAARVREAPTAARPVRDPRVKR